MPTTDEPPIGIRRLGREREPVVVIDGYSGMADELAARAAGAHFADGGAAYPGIRAPVDARYLDRRRDLLMQVMREVFGFRQRIELEAANFSLVTRKPEELQPIQCLPHYDDASGEVIAVMHYLRGADTGGTAFYRHRRTGFEAITPERQAEYGAALRADHEEYGMPDRRYHYGDTARFEMIGEVEPRPDRLILYRGWLLHSGVIPDPAALASDPATGRLTVNMFLVGR